jgi:Tfp pilus assembly protein PilF
MKIKNVNNSKHILPDGTTEKSAGTGIQERNNMGRTKIFLLFISVLFLLLQGCNKRISPSGTDTQSVRTIDTTAFDYVFTEALKQKFLGNAGDALKYLEQALEINPGSDAAYYEMAQVALMMSDGSNGKKFALKAAALNEKNIWYLMLIGNIYYGEKVLDSAILFYEKAVKYFPEKENVKLNLAGIYAEKGENEKADIIYSYFESKYGVNEATSLSMVKSLMNSGNYKKAEEIVIKLLEKYPDVLLYNGLLAEIYHSTGEKEKAIDVYNKLIEKDPGNPQTLLSLSEFLMEEKSYDELFQVLNKIVLNDSIAREEKISIMAKAIEDSTLVRARGMELEMTLYILEATKKDDDIYVLLRPELYQKQKNLKGAITRLEEIIVSKPDNYLAWEKLLLLYSETGDWDKLYTKGNECATRFNRSFLAKILFASAAQEKGQLDVAEEELRKAKILAGDQKDFLFQVLVMEADLFYKKKQYNKCWETFKEALNQKPGDIMVLNNYAYYLAEQGLELKEAERMAKIVIDTEKENTTYLDTYGWVLYKREKYREAQKIMEKILSKNEKQDAVWYEHLGYILKAQKKCEKAIEYWRLALKLDSSKTLLQKEIDNCGKR